MKLINQPIIGVNWLPVYAVEPAARTRSNDKRERLRRKRDVWPSWVRSKCSPHPRLAQQCTLRSTPFASLRRRWWRGCRVKASSWRFVELDRTHPWSLLYGLEVSASAPWRPPQLGGRAVPWEVGERNSAPWGGLPNIRAEEHRNEQTGSARCNARQCNRRWCCQWKKDRKSCLTKDRRLSVNLDRNFVTQRQKPRQKPRH